MSDDDRRSDRKPMSSTDGQRPMKPDHERNTYELLDRLERLESLREDMLELGVTTLDQVETEIAELNELLDMRER